MKSTARVRAYCKRKSESHYQNLTFHEIGPSRNVSYIKAEGTESDDDQSDNHEDWIYYPQVEIVKTCTVEEDEDSIDQLTEIEDTIEDPFNISRSKSKKSVEDVLESFSTCLDAIKESIEHSDQTFLRTVVSFMRTLSPKDNDNFQIQVLTTIKNFKKTS